MAAILQVAIVCADMIQEGVQVIKGQVAVLLDAFVHLQDTQTGNKVVHIFSGFLVQYTVMFAVYVLSERFGGRTMEKTVCPMSLYVKDCD